MKLLMPTVFVFSLVNLASLYAIAIGWFKPAYQEEFVALALIFSFIGLILSGVMGLANEQ